MIKRYAGIGTRDMNWKGVNYRPIIYSNLRELHDDYGLAEACLNSGAADGMDDIHEKVHDEYYGKKSIFLPWRKFNGHSSTLWHLKPAAIELAYKFHPLGNKLEGPALKLIARNGYQILDYELDTPVDVVICGTPYMDRGGTSQAIRIAKYYKIPVFNLFFDGEFERLKDFLRHGK